MVEDGATAGVDNVLALHVDSMMAVGDIGLEAGPISAGVDSFYVTIIGQGGHGSAPHEVVDPIYLSAHVLLALHGIVSRRMHPWTPAVISVGSIHAGEADNVIPEQVKMSGTIRFMTPEVQQQIHAEIERALGVARALGGDYELEIVAGGPPVVNDVAVTELLRQVVDDLLGPGHIPPPKHDMGAEDFAAFTALAPGAMFGLGCRRGEEIRPAHSPTFDVDERCLPIGTAILAETALRLLRG
jgi:amidohydrolase